MLTFLINLNSTHNDCNIREAFTVLRECTLPECLEYDICFFFFAFLSFSFYLIVPHTALDYSLFAFINYLEALSLLNIKSP